MRKLLKDSGRRYQLLVKRIDADILACENSSELDNIRTALAEALLSMQNASNYLLDKQIDMRDAEAAATDYLHLVGLVAGGWMWLRIALAATKTDDEKQYLIYAKYYAGDMVSRASLLLQKIQAGSKLLDAISNESLTNW